MITIASLDASRVATTQAQAIEHEGNRGRRVAVSLLRNEAATREDALAEILRSVERQARIAGCGRILLEVAR